MASLRKRGKSYYAQYYIGKTQKRVNLYTESLQIAKEKLRQLESALYLETDIPLPTRTPLIKVVEEYVDYLFTVKSDKNAQKIVSYLRHVFGPICPKLQIKNQKISDKAVKRKALRSIPPIEVSYFEQITTTDIARFIESVVRNKGVKGKTANRYREILTRLYNWATSQRNIVLPGGKNPASQVERYKEVDPTITYLPLPEIDEQLAMLAGNLQMQTMVAVYIYAGLRREEAVWLTSADINLNMGLHGMIQIRAKTINGVEWQPKTHKNRVVPISSQLRAYLDRYVPMKTKEGWYFPSPEGTCWDPDNLSRDMRHLNEEADLDWSCADFRHTFGSHLAMKGESLYKISKLMGNSPEVCRKHYATLIPDSLIESVEFPTIKKESAGDKLVFPVFGGASGGGHNRWYCAAAMRSSFDFGVGGFDNAMYFCLRCVHDFGFSLIRVMSFGRQGPTGPALDRIRNPLAPFAYRRNHGGNLSIGQP
jgi:integrase